MRNRVSRVGIKAWRESGPAGFQGGRAGDAWVKDVIHVQDIAKNDFDDFPNVRAIEIQGDVAGRRIDGWAFDLAHEGSRAWHGLILKCWRALSASSPRRMPEVAAVPASSLASLPGQGRQDIPLGGIDLDRGIPVGTLAGGQEQQGGHEHPPPMTAG
jgi:hypothetical protein